MLHQFLFTDPGKELISYKDLALIISKLPGEQTGNGAFPAAGLSHKRHKGTLGYCKTDVFEDLPVFFIGKSYFPKFYVEILPGHRLFSVFWLFQIQEPEDLITGRHTVHCYMEKRSQKPQGNEKLRGQKDNGQSSGKIQASCQKFTDRHYHSHSSAPICHNIHNTGRIQLHGQDLHGDPPEFLGLPVHLLCFLFICLVNFQSCQPLEIFQKTVSQPCIDPPVSAQKFFCKFLHRYNRHRDQRYTDQQHQTGFQIYKR